MARLKASDFPQELLDLLHEYIHGDVDRRQFLDTAKKFAIGGLTLAMIEENLIPNYAFAQQIPKDDRRLKVEYINYPSPDGNNATAPAAGVTSAAPVGTMKAYLARPANATGKLPGVLVIHENRGLTPYVEDVARRAGIANFIALAPDALTPLGGYPGDDQRGQTMQAQLNGAKITEDLIAGAKYLKAHPDCTGKIGAVGFCFGGAQVNTLAVRLGADLSAGVPFYGRQPTNAAEIARIKAPLLLQYAETDAGITPLWPAYETALKAASVPATGYIYPGTQHGFHNDSTARFDKAAADLAWQRTIDFFNKYLR